ncbi:ester cyclase [Piscirickettsia salmonis]|uniref:ester cyclase n=1 Tax=Piscirickettsia salmonis TaxID=1238 RepID=UPI0007C89705|nr:SnoaL-like polyketide cyclase [Piscirickettsiaceae bacterium NZ-RLO1]
MSISITSSPDENTGKLLIEKMFNCMWNQQRPELADDIFSADVIIHTADGTSQGLKALEGFIIEMQTAFSNLQHHCHEIINNNNRVSARFSGQGTHTGTFQGMPATGRSFKFTGMGFYHIKDGKIIEFWLENDMSDFMAALEGSQSF